MKKIYVIDTSSLINLDRHYPEITFPSVWENIESLFKNKSLISPREVFKELQQRNDHIKNWSKQHLTFEKPTEQQINTVKSIVTKFPELVNLDKPNSADPWVIALAVSVNNTNTLDKIDTKIITEENLKGTKVVIPWVSKEFKIKVIKSVELFREQKWKF